MAKPLPFPYVARFFVLRCPLLPAEALAGDLRLATPDAHGAELEAAVAADRAAIAAHFRRLVARGDVREALWLSSPDLVRALDRWELEPEHPEVRNVTASLYRYLARMSRRPTPFGLSAGVGCGEVGHRTTLRVESLRAHSRLDMGWLSALEAGLEPRLRSLLRYRTNSSLYRTADQLRYAEARFDPTTQERTNDQVALLPTPAIEAALAATPGSPMELARAVVAAHPDVSEEEALGFVDGLIDAGVLEPELGAPLTAIEPLKVLIEGLRALDGALAGRLARVQGALEALDRSPPGRPLCAYAALSPLLDEFPLARTPRQLLQVDLHSAGTLSLGPRVIRTIEAVIGLLHRITPSPEGGLERLQEGLERRFGGGFWPLAEVLDEERGVGFLGGTGRSSEPSPLLAGLALQAPTSPSVSLGARGRWMLRRALEAGPGGEWVLNEEDIEALANPAPLPLPDGLAFVGTLEAEHAEAVDQGRFLLRVQSVAGPSGASLLGRFAGGDGVLRARIEEHLRAEEAWAPEAIFAEIVHSPEGRTGNVIVRPPLRPYEIPYMGRGSAPPERQIPIEDLRVGFKGGRCRLFSARHGREVIPRLTCAHNFGMGELPIYRFLAEVQRDGVASALGWSWGALSALPSLPRVRWREAILSPALWNLEPSELVPLREARGAERVLAARALRARRQLPREVVVMDGDRVLPVDLENAVALDALVHLAQGVERLTLSEVRGGLCVEGPEGRLAHELVVPLVRAGGPARTARPPEPTRSPRAWLPGSPWITAKIYTGTLTADSVLVEAVAPLVAALREEGLLERWFFIRYADPEWHLRVRLRVPRAAVGEVGARLYDALEPWQRDRRIWSLVLDTYQPEVERYGGDAGLPLSEQLFEADSDAVVAIVAQLDGDAGAEARWRLALRSVHLLLEDFALPARAPLLEGWSAFWVRRLGLGGAFEASLSQRFRALRESLGPLIEADWPEEHELAPGFVILAERSERLRPVVAALREAALTEPLPGLVESYAHMAMNRILRAQANEVEMVVYAFLSRLYRSAAARGDSGRRPSS